MECAIVKFWGLRGHKREAILSPAWECGRASRKASQQRGPWGNRNSGELGIQCLLFPEYVLKYCAGCHTMILLSPNNNFVRLKAWKNSTVCPRSHTWSAMTVVFEPLLFLILKLGFSTIPALRKKIKFGSLLMFEADCTLSPANEKIINA